MENNLEIEMVTVDTKTISPYSKIKVYWDDRPENYSKIIANTASNHYN